MDLAHRAVTRVVVLLLFAAVLVALPSVERARSAPAVTLDVFDLNTGTGHSHPFGLTASGGRLFFHADDGLGCSGSGRELWSASPGGTPSLVVDLNDSTSGCNGLAGLASVAPFGTGVAFAGWDGTFRGTELYLSDGSAGGTTLVRDIWLNGNDSNPNYLTPFAGGSKLAFRARDAFGEEPWITDGTESGTTRVADVHPDGDSSPDTFARVGSSGFVFVAEDGDTGQWTLFSSTGSGVTALGQFDPDSIVPFGDAVVFGAYEEGFGWEPWISDGTPGGTFRLADANPGEVSSAPDAFTAVGNLLFFVADTAGYGDELWVTDGTTAGTFRVKDINPGSGNGGPFDAGAFKGRLYFSGSDGVHGPELWISDGTDAGTTLVADLVPGSTGSGPRNFTVVGDNLFFTAAGGLWGTDGTGPGTVMVAEGVTFSASQQFAALGDNELWFVASDSTHGEELWRATVTSVVPNGPPVLDPIGAGTATVEVEFSFIATATDPDGDPLTYSLDPGTGGPVPTGASIDPSGGAFSWTPTSDQVGDHTFDIVVSDGSLEDRESVTVTVTEALPSLSVETVGSVTVDDLVTIILELLVEEADVITVEDVVTVLLELDVPAGETLSVGELITILVELTVPAGEPIAVDDAVSVILGAFVATDEVVSVQDTVAILLGLVAPSVERVSVEDVVTVLLEMGLAADEPITVSDLVTMFVELDVASDDPIGVMDAVEVNVMDPPGIGSLEGSEGQVASAPRGATLTFTGRGFRPNTTIAFELRSDPIELGSAIADANGDFSFEFTIPSHTPPGPHTVAGIGVNVDEELYEVTAELLVLAPPTLTVGAASPVQYSDGIQPIEITYEDDDEPAGLALSVTGLPDGLAVTAPSCDGAPVGCTAEIRGVVNGPAGEYVASISVSDADGLEATVQRTITVAPEQASVALDPTNPVDVSVTEAGGPSGPFALDAEALEADPDEGWDPQPGDTALAGTTISLRPVSGGEDIAGSCTAGSAGAVSCSFDGVPAGAYGVVAAASREYYQGADESVLTVSDPSLGFAVGGGWFPWPETGDRTNVAFSMKKHKGAAQGSVVVVRHLTDGTTFKLRGETVDRLSVGTHEDGTWAWGSGLATFEVAGGIYVASGYSFELYAEDHAEPGAGEDRIWFRLRDADDVEVAALTVGESGQTVALGGGHISIPYSKGEKTPQ